VKESWHTCEGVMAHSKTCAVGSCDIHRSVASSDIGSFDIDREWDLVMLIIGSGILRC